MGRGGRLVSNRLATLHLLAGRVTLPTMNAGPSPRRLSALLLALALFASPALAAKNRPAAPSVSKLDLPLIAVPAKAPGPHEPAVPLPGDAGWAPTDKGPSAALAKRGT